MRLLIGAVQGLAIWHLTHDSAKHAAGFPNPGHWWSSHPVLFAGLFLALALGPVSLLGGLGQLRRRTMIVMSTVVLVALFSLGAYAGWRRIGGDDGFWPRPGIFLMGAAALFIAHHLVAASDEHRSLRAPYAAYFDIAWKHGVQLALSAGFTGAFWLTLLLGTALFDIIGIKGFGEFVRHDWFVIPATTIIFAAAVQLTDVRSGLVQGIRTVALTLLSWLMPLLAGIAAGFVASLAFTGTKPLFDTGNAAELLLSAAGALIILINAAYQDGDGDEPRPAFIRWGARVAAIVLIPLMGLSAYAMALRIGDYGFTPERILATACLVVGSAYTVGYAIAAVRRGPWMRGLETTNILTGYLALVVLILLLSPVLDPARISVADQMHRLAAGKTAPEKFDYRFLRFDGARFGRAALQQLAAKPPAGPSATLIAQKAAAVLKAKNRYEGVEAVATEFKVFPAGRTVPAEVLSDPEAYERIQCTVPGACVAAYVDLDGDGKEELVVARFHGITIYEATAKGWRRAGGAVELACEADRQALAAGRLRSIPSEARDLEINGQRFHRQAPIDQFRACPEDRRPGAKTPGATVTVPAEISREE